ncbi:Gfo/Idh/MocA family oxidoreductase [bacterium]|nr:Gfo/Idh/MocA family oxidoreductase [bacterium]
MTSLPWPRVAVVGAGYWGPNLVRNLLRIDSGAVAAVCDLDEARLAALRNAFPGVRTTASLNDIVTAPDIDAVMLALPPGLHVETGLRVLAAGKDLFVEKPVALDVEGVFRLTEAARRGGRVFMAGFTYLYNPMINALGERIAAGELGSVRAAHSRRVNLNTRRKHMNVVWALAPHDVAIFQSWFGGEPSGVSGLISRERDARFADVADVGMDFAGGVRTSIRLSWLAPTKTRRLIVVGERRVAVYDETAAAHRVDLYENNAGADADIEALDGRLLDALGAPVDAIEAAGGMEEPLGVECRHFLECVRDRTDPRTGGAEALAVTRTVERLLEAGRHLSPRAAVGAM